VNASLARIDAEIIALEDEVLDDEERQLCAGSLAAFARLAWPVLEPATPLKWGWALDAICDHLEAVSSGDLKRVLINVPPGSMKSLLTGVLFPAWEWGPRARPALRYIGTAHKQDLAVRDNMKCRRLIQSKWYQRLWPIILTGDQNAKTKFENDATGFREAMAFTSMTGSRGDRIILDDPHSVDDANSVAKLDADILTFREALPSRVNNDDSAIIIIMQRLHERDVSAIACELGYEHLMIPMRYEPERARTTSIGWSDPRSKAGELMFPDRFPERQVDELERTLGAYATAGQLQQRPAPREGGLFKPSWFTPIAAMPVDIHRTVRGWDLAATAKTTSNDPDWTAGVLMSRTRDGLFIIHGCRRFQGSPMEVEHSLLQQSAADGNRVTVRLAQDPGAAGKAHVDGLVRKLAGFPVKIERPTGDKATRAAPLASQAEAGNVRILVTGDPVRDAWVQPFLDEFALFPAGAHDDQVDAAADAFNELALGGSSYNLSALAG
jgi:predicted phage terminase large subunit-like protein